MTLLIVGCAALTLQSVKADPRSATFEHLDVQIRVTVVGNDYTYQVTNRGSCPITRFEIAQINTYKHLAPDGWQTGKDRHLFSAWATEQSHGIHPDQSKSLEMRVASTGAVLTEGVAQVTFADGHVTDVRGVWRPGAQSTWTKIFFSSALAMIILAHTVWLGLRRRRADTPLT